MSWLLFTFLAVAARRPDRGFQRLFPVHEPLTLNSVERRLMALNSLRFCCATVAQNSRKFSGGGRGLKLCLGKMSDGKFAVLHQRHRCAHRCGRQKALVAWLRTVRSRVSKTVSTVISDNGTTGFATLEATRLAPGEATSEASRCQRAVSTDEAFRATSGEAQNPCPFKG